ncbi:uncharacterized protein B0H64DRAFT_389309 [Chaetomium fimeti]|uniref:Uncharacterized protein n=1 Tax=Chaetomium fimeti TaxID=1854472 RepID=A0AAE0HP04_9PEZI|nr:hypothetical protein B0H64DRAFT_389309 [Chaetomium fimeti]
MGRNARFRFFLSLSVPFSPTHSDKLKEDMTGNMFVTRCKTNWHILSQRVTTNNGWWHRTITKPSSYKQRSSRPTRSKIFGIQH